MKKSYMPLSELLGGEPVKSEVPADDHLKPQKQVTKFPSVRMSVLASALEAHAEPRRKRN